MEKNGELSQDEHHLWSDEFQGLTDDHVKEIDVNDFIRYGHTNTDVPRIIAKVNGFIYAFYYEGYLVEAERILSGFRTNSL